MSTETIATIKPISSREVEWQGWTEGSRFGERYRHLTGALTAT